jgi:hypothetical protein
MVSILYVLKDCEFNTQSAQFSYVKVLFSTGLGVVLFSQPPNGTLIANFEGAMNATTLFCNISGDGINQITTTWSIQNYRGSTGLVDITSSPEPFIVSGPPNPLAPQFSLLNELTVSNWSSDLDGATIFCGTGQDQREASFFLRAYRKSKPHTDYNIIAVN